MRWGLGFGLAAVGLAGCEPMPPSGRPFEAVRGPPAPAVAPQPAAGAPNRPAPPRATPEDPFADSREDEPAPAPGAGGATALDPSGAIVELAPGAAPSGPGPAAGASTGPGPVPVWDAAMPLPDVSFGVQLTAVIPDRYPPRAVLALPDGQEVVVTPGSMLPAHGLVVLAIGANGVRVAHVTPSGYQARVVTETIGVLSPVEAPPP